MLQVQVQRAARVLSIESTLSSTFVDVMAYFIGTGRSTSCPFNHLNNKTCDRAPARSGIRDPRKLGFNDIKSTAWDSEIESLTSLNPSLIELDCRKTRRRHRVTAALAPRKSCFLPCNANLHAISASPEAWFTTAFLFRMIQLSSSSARRDHSCDH